jgi:hypothetical protein
MKEIKKSRNRDHVISKKERQVLLICKDTAVFIRGFETASLCSPGK